MKIKPLLTIFLATFVCSTNCSIQRQVAKSLFDVTSKALRTQLDRYVPKGVSILEEHCRNLVYAGRQAILLQHVSYRLKNDKSKKTEATLDLREDHGEKGNVRLSASKKGPMASIIFNEKDVSHSIETKCQGLLEKMGFKPKD